MFILPVAKDNPTKNIPWVVIGLIVLNSAILVVTYGDLSSGTIFRRYGFVPARPQTLTLFTSMFLHEGFWHLIGNMWFLWMFGNQVENMFGSFGFSFLYFASGLGGSWLHYLLNQHSTVPCVGASGAISGVVGAYFIFFPNAKFDLDIFLGWWLVKTIPARTHAAVGAWIGEQLLLGLISQATHGLGVAFWAHVGGFAVGGLSALLFLLIVPKDKFDERFEARPWFMQGRYSRDDSDITELKL